MKSHPFGAENRPHPAKTIAVSVLLLIFAFALFACGDSSEGDTGECDAVSVLFAPKEGESIASMGDEALVTVEEMKERVEQQSPFMQPRLQTPEGLRGLVDQMVQFELLAREAARQDFHLDPMVQQALKRAMVSRLVAKRMEEAEEGGEVSDELLQEFYERNISDFVQPERVRVSHIFFATEEASEDRGSARAEAGEKLAELRSSATDDAGTFSRLARQESDDAQSRVVGGDLRYQTIEDLAEAWGQSMADAAFGLERVGTISEVVEGEKGYHILRLIGRQRAVDRKLDDVRPQILNRVRREERNRRFEEFVEEIGEREGLSVDEAVLERLMVTGQSAGAGEGSTAEAPPVGEGAEN